VDIDSESYRVARGFMIRLGREDIERQEMLERHAAIVGLTTDAFHNRFGYLVTET